MSGHDVHSLPLCSSFILSTVGFLVLGRMIPRSKQAFISAGLSGRDMSKKDKPVVPEALGILVAAVYIVLMFLFIPLPFLSDIAFEAEQPEVFKRFISQLAAILSICCMIFLGMSDDVFDLRWRDKLLLPSVASLPLLMVYYVTYNVTSIAMPLPVRPWIGDNLDIGLLYYMYMGFLAVFCTNSINILAGINGLEVGQSVVITVSLMIFNIIELTGESSEAHHLSLYLLTPFLGCSLALLRYNWYPSQVFVGDTYCYFAGMLFAVVGILGHFSKSLLLMFIPQIINFVYSAPQLFRLIPCPRHRLPRYDSENNVSCISTTEFKFERLPLASKLIITVFRRTGLLRVMFGSSKDEMDQCNNLTLINLVLLHSGPLREDKLCLTVLAVQILFSIVAFTIRYPLAHYLYGAS